MTEVYLITKSTWDGLEICSAHLTKEGAQAGLDKAKSIEPDEYERQFYDIDILEAND